MERTSGRKPVGNFFIKRSLQFGLMSRIVLSIVICTIISACIIVLVYVLQHRSIQLYQLHESGNLIKQSIFFFILPSLNISLVINILVGIAVGLYASRKYAVPIYKLEQWAQRLRDGKFNTRLRFREQKQMAELSGQFNSLTEDMRMKLMDVRTTLEAMTPDPKDAERVKSLCGMLAKLDLSTGNPVTADSQIEDR
jgi:methyl-accepting chemotaxis protein